MKFRDFVIKEEFGQQYRSLNDAVKYFPSLAKGNTEVWYQTVEFSRDGMMGVKWLEKQGLLPDPKTFPIGKYYDTKTNKEMTGQTHILLGKIKETDLDEIFFMLQGERWSPQGEARTLIKSKGLFHTSMSVGDIVKTKNKYYIVDRFGWKKL